MLNFKDQVPVVEDVQPGEPKGVEVVAMVRRELDDLRRLTNEEIGVNMLGVRGPGIALTVAGALRGTLLGMGFSENDFTADGENVVVRLPDGGFSVGGGESVQFYRFMEDTSSSNGVGCNVKGGFTLPDSEVVHIGKI